MKLDTFFDNFGLLADAPNGVQKLREMVLQLAVQGKLVPQDPKDEPASVLLKKNKAVKERLIKEKKMRSGAPLPPIDTDIVPYGLPMSWAWSRLGTIGRIVGGGTPKTGQSEYFSEQGISWLTPADLYKLEGKYIARGRRDISALGLQKSSAQLMNRGTVLFSSRAPIGYVAIATNDLCTNQGFKSCVPFIIAMNEYIYYFLKHAAKAIDRQASGTTFKEVSGKIVSEIMIPVPPLKEQKRIVAKVDELMALCDELEARKKRVSTNCIQLNDASIHKLQMAREPKKFSKHWQRICDNFDLLYGKPENVNKLRQAILQLAVQGKLVPQDPKDEPASILLENIKAEKERLVKDKKIKKPKPSAPVTEIETSYVLPTNWEWVRFGDCTYCRDGERIPISKSERRLRHGPYPYFGASGIIDQIDDYLFAKPLLLIGEDGANLLRRSTPIAFIARGKYWVNNHAHVIDGITEAFLRYLELYINSISLEAYVTGTAQPKMNQAKMNSIVVALAPEEEQKRIVTKVDELMALCNELETSLSKSQTDCDKLMEATVAMIMAA